MLNDKHIRVCHHKYTYYPRIAKQTLKSNCLCTHWRPRTVSEILGHLLLVRDCTLHLANVLNQHTSNAYCALLIFLRHLCGTGRLVREVRIYIHRMQHLVRFHLSPDGVQVRGYVYLFFYTHCTHTHTPRNCIYGEQLDRSGKKMKCQDDNAKTRRTSSRVAEHTHTHITMRTYRC